ncbi:MAG: hypothetical protein OEZ59_02060 [Deltaproteobacteria bacterium]|nr:hypothetical protein [Deltaproteobacteria bacterium]
MKDVIIGNIKPVDGSQRTSRAKEKGKTSGQGVEFQKNLENAQVNISKAGQEAKPASGELTASNVQQEMVAANKQLEQMMLAKQHLSKAYQMVQQGKADKKE